MIQRATTEMGEGISTVKNLAVPSGELQLAGILYFDRHAVSRATRDQRKPCHLATCLHEKMLLQMILDVLVQYVG